MGYHERFSFEFCGQRPKSETCEVGNLPLSDLQSKSLERFAEETTNSAVVDGDYVESLIAAKKAKRDYDLLWIPSSSNTAERLISRVKWILSDQRKKTLPVTLESMTSLFYNKSYWNAKLIHDICL